MSDLSNLIFHDETKAREWLEARVWKAGRVCPKCGVVDQSTLMQGKSHRPGLYQCNACREPFTVTVGTLYERSKVPLHKWLAVTHLMMASKKGMSALQISRMIGLSYKTTWFLCHRIRESLRPDESLPSTGGANTPVEADETYVGGKAKNRASHGAPKKPVLAFIERDDGHVRSFHIANVSASSVKPLIPKNVEKASVLIDESPIYFGIGRGFDAHDSVNHSKKEYARLGGDIHINTAGKFLLNLQAGRDRQRSSRLKGALAPRPCEAGTPTHDRECILREHMRHGWAQADGGLVKRAGKED